MNATMKPTYQATSLRASSRPRIRAGANSLISGQPTEYSAPIATPISSRTRNSCQAESTKNCAAEARRNSAMSAMNSGLRPNLSDSQPPIGDPMKMPSSAAAAIRPSQSTENSRSVVILPITVPMIPRMYPSMNIPPQRTAVSLIRKRRFAAGSRWVFPTDLSSVVTSSLLEGSAVVTAVRTTTRRRGGRRACGRVVGEGVLARPALTVGAAAPFVHQVNAASKV